MSSEETAADVAIRVRDVSKHFLLFDRPQDRLKQSIVPRLQRLVGRPPTRYYRDFAALSGVSFEVRRGETVGIVGRNGSGKSTLLQVVCGTLRPNAGSVTVNGRIAALLELGAGFNPEFTGRENVYLNAAILGLSREETDARFDDIARFADIGDFIGQPVKTYSSGMYVRLAFATAINVDPDILVVDEALSVGDEAFQRKCFARIEQIQERGGTILFVTHSAQLVVQLCSRALLMDRGELIMDGRPKLVTSQYQRLVNLSGAEAESVRCELKGFAIDQPQLSALGEAEAEDHDTHVADGIDDSFAVTASQNQFDSRFLTQSRMEYDRHGAAIDNVRLEDRRGNQVNILFSGERYTIAYDVTFDADVRNVAFGAGIKSISGVQLSGTSTRLASRLRDLVGPRGETVRVRISFDCHLNAGVFFINCGVRATVGDDDRYLHRVMDALVFRVVCPVSRMSTDLVDLNFDAKISPCNNTTSVKRSVT